MYGLGSTFWGGSNVSSMPTGGNLSSISAYSLFLRRCVTKLYSKPRYNVWRLLCYYCNLLMHRQQLFRLSMSLTASSTSKAHAVLQQQQQQQLCVLIIY